MNRIRVFLVVIAGACSASAGCKGDQPQATPEPPTTVSSAPSAASVSTKGRMNLRNPMPLADVDPQTMKEYRVDTCYFGTLSLRQAKTAYLTSLANQEPSEKKIPNFGVPPVPPVAAAGVDAGAPKPPIPIASVSPAVRVAASAGDAGVAPPPHHEIPLRPYDRFAKACSIAAAMATPPTPDVDKALAEYTPFALDLSKTIVQANAYYQHEDFKTDAFVKGKEFHKTLMASFAKLDELQGHLGDAVAAWHKDHPADAAKLEGAQKPTEAAIEAGRTIVVGKRIDVSTLRTGVDKVGAALAELKVQGDQNASDVYVKMMSPALTNFEKIAREAIPRFSPERGYDPEDLLKMSTTFTALLDANQRALSRLLISKGQTIPGSPPPRHDPAVLTPPPAPAAPSASAP